MAGMFRRNKAKSQEKQWRDWAERFESMGPVAQAEAWNALDQEHRLYVEQQFGIRRPSRSETRAALDAIKEVSSGLEEFWPGLSTHIRNSPGTKEPLSTLDEDGLRAFKQEFHLAAVAMSAIALRNLFPEDQAKRLLQKYTEICAEAMELDIGYVEQAFKEYRERLDDDVEATAQPEDKALHCGIGDVLCGRVGLGLGETFPEYKPGEFFLAPIHHMGLSTCFLDRAKPLQLQEIKRIKGARKGRPQG